MDILGKIFKSDARVKIMRLFLFNDMYIFDMNELAEKTILDKKEIRKEIALLEKIHFLKKKNFTKKIPQKITKKNPKQSYKTKKTQGWVLDKSFSLIPPLKALLIDSQLINEKDFVKKIRKTGIIKLIVLSGVFVKSDNRELDILIVGNKIKKNLLEKEILKLESEIGRELSYAVFNELEYQYRIDMHDKLIRDIMENEKMVILNRFSS